MWERLRRILDRPRATRAAKEQARAAAAESAPSSESTRKVGVSAWLTRVGDALGAGRSAAFNWLPVIASVVVVIAIVRETTNTTPVIQPVSLPDSLINLG